jgi:hypothetical protein
MLYLGIDQHARQITIALRDENGDVLLARQVSTQPDKIHAFFQQLTRERLHKEEHFVAVSQDFRRTAFNQKQKGDNAKRYCYVKTRRKTVSA